MAQTSQKSSKKARFQTKLLKYSTAAGAALTLSHSADAVINTIDVTGLSLTLSGDNASDSFDLDLNGDSTIDYSFNGRNSKTFQPIITFIPTSFGSFPFTIGTFSVYSGVISGTNANNKFALDGNIAKLGTGSGVKAAVSTSSAGAGTFIRSYNGGLSGNFTPSFSGSDSGFVGLKFDISGADHYGWLEVIVSRSGGRPSELSVLSGAYETQPGVDIAAGAIPEPASVGMGLGLLALGAAGVRSMRRQPRA